MKKFASESLTIIVILVLCLNSFATDGNLSDYSAESVGKFLFETVKEPTISPIGGEWTILGLARSDVDIPKEYFENYYRRVEKYVTENKGIVHSKKYTEYSRLILALSAIGKNPENVAGYNLLTPLGDYEKTIMQGINGAIWALIALDCNNYPIPTNLEAGIQATREMYINHILEKQTPDGGWTLSGNTADADITGMALQALSRYRSSENVESAINRALSCLSSMQNENGGFSSYDTENSESCVQVIVALCELNIPLSDERFVKNGKTLFDNLITFYDNEKSFKHTHNDDTNLMATEQCFYALVALKRAEMGKNSLYNMSDAGQIGVIPDTEGLPGKNSDVRKMSISNPGKTFTDITGHKDKTSIEALASREIINGKTEYLFEPDNTMTRAEFATIVTKALGLPQKCSGVFTDVYVNDWFYNYVGTAYSYGIIKGVSENEFNPYGTITREEVAVMITRAAKLCGIYTEFEKSASRDILAQFSDYIKASEWSVTALAFCFNSGILDDSVMDINPKEPCVRGEIACMLYNMLCLANLI